MTTLLLRLQGPMQSWGTTSVFDERDTQLEPSKSGIIGLVCAALGRDRAESIADLCALRMGVRVDQEGIPMRDFQTVKGIITADGKYDSKKTVVSPRYYLADAVFLVGLEGECALLEKIYAALSTPVWSLALGRKSFMPSMPIHLSNALSEDDLEAALKRYPWLLLESMQDTDKAKQKEPKDYRLLLEHLTEGSVRHDQPLAPFSERRFGPRLVRSIKISQERSDYVSN